VQRFIVPAQIIDFARQVHIDRPLNGFASNWQPVFPGA
jgi:hypothetical protein